MWIDIDRRANEGEKREQMTKSNTGTHSPTTDYSSPSLTQSHTHSHDEQEQQQKFDEFAVLSSNTIRWTVQKQQHVLATTTAYNSNIILHWRTAMVGEGENGGLLSARHSKLLLLLYLSTQQKFSRFNFRLLAVNSTLKHIFLICPGSVSSWNYPFFRHVQCAESMSGLK